MIPQKWMYAALISFMLIACSCSFQDDANRRFGDQHFKTVISLVELHKIRTGSYPKSLNDIQFKGDWDAIAISSVEYEKTESGYNLKLINGWAGMPKLSYPKAFWKGLGIEKSNIGTDSVNHNDK